MNNRTINVIVAAIVAICILVVATSLAALATDGSTIQRIAYLLGGDLPYGLIQGTCYFLFTLGTMELLQLTKEVKGEYLSLDKGFLPEREQYVITPEDVNAIKLQVIEQQKEFPYILLDIVNKACTKFRSSHNIGESMEVVKTLASVNNKKFEAKQTLVRYIAWAIPSIGFIGTVLGIANALGAANEAMDPEGIEHVTSLLMVAFDTTLIALLLNIVLMFSLNALGGRMEAFFAQVEEYIIENLINRIYLG